MNPPSDEDIDPAKIDPMAYPNPPVDTDDAAEETSASPAEQSDQANDGGDDSFPASDPPGNY